MDTGYCTPSSLFDYFVFITQALAAQFNSESPVSRMSSVVFFMHFKLLILFQMFTVAVVCAAGCHLAAVVFGRICDWRSHLSFNSPNCISHCVCWLQECFACVNSDIHCSNDEEGARRGVAGRGREENARNTDKIFHLFTKSPGSHLAYISCMYSVLLFCFSRDSD